MAEEAEEQAALRSHPVGSLSGSDGHHMHVGLASVGQLLTLEVRPESFGYMGNYGNTLDRWYRRAAVVLWPRQQAFAVRAEASPGWALDALASRLESGDVAGAQADAAALAPFWDSAARGEPKRGFFTKALEVALELGEPATAAALLAPFQVEMLGPGHAAALTRMVERYGEHWAGDLIQGWSGRAVHRGGEDRPAWLALLPRLCEALQGRRAAAERTAQARIAPASTS